MAGLIPERKGNKSFWIPTFLPWIKNIWRDTRYPQWIKRVMEWFWIALGAGAILFGILFLCINYALFGFEPLPTIEQLENPSSKLASEVYAADGVLLGKFYRENRSNSEFDELPPHLINALIATEDVRFEKHCGIDFKGLFTASFRTFVLQSPSGASTITQQLAKNLFHKRSLNTVQRILQKMKEWIIAVKLERSYTKQEIVTMYLNTVEFSQGAHGIKSASRAYFNKSPQELKVEESAVLVGLLKGSTLYNPLRNKERSRNRRNTVISQMEKYGFLTTADADSIKKLDLITSPMKEDHDEGLATYFREFLKAEVKKWADEKNSKENTNIDIYQDGLKIYTTIDSRMQKYAEEAVNVHLTKLQKEFIEHWKGDEPWKDDKEFFDRAIKQSERYRTMSAKAKANKDSIDKEFKTKIQMKIYTVNGERDTLISPMDSIRNRKMILHSGFMAMDPKNGDIKAWVGDFNYKYFKYDNVRPTSKRQVGSTFKPFVYTLAIQNGWSPCQKLPNVPITFAKGEYGAQEAWTPKNSDDYYNYQLVTIQYALAKSLNLITARLMKEIGPKPVIELVRKLGISSHIDPYPAICLGTPDISLYEMVGAYSVYANKGEYSKPRFITRIEDKNGRTLAVFPMERKEVMSEPDAFVMNRMLQGVTNIGTGYRLRSVYGLRGEIAGKTGTTNDHSDGWYIGITPQLIAGVWTGGDEKIIHFKTLALGSGGNMALPIWGEFFKRVYADKELDINPDAKFEWPRMPLNVEMDCAKFNNEEPATTDPSGDYYESTKYEEELF